MDSVNLFPCGSEAGGETNFRRELLIPTEGVHRFLGVVGLAVAAFEAGEREGDQLIQSVTDTGHDLLASVDGAPTGGFAVATLNGGFFPLVGDPDDRARPERRAARMWRSSAQAEAATR